MTGVFIALWYAACVVVGVLIVQSATPWGIGIRHDSLSYLTAAQSLGRAGCLCRVGGGLELKPLVHFGPLYPTLLWAVGLAAGDILVAARWIAAVLYGLNLALWGGLVHLHARRWWAGALVSVILAVSAVMLQVHDAAMSEPLFLALLALALMALTDFLAGGRRRGLWFAAAAVAAAVLTRYAAAALIGLGALAIVVLRRGPWRARLKDAAAFVVVAALPLVLWSIRNLVSSGSATNRMLGWHPIDIDDLRGLLQIVTAWFTSASFSHWIEGTAFLALLAGLAFFLWRTRAASGEAVAPAAVLGLQLVGLAAFYPIFIFVSKSLFDDSVPIDDRMFAPLYFALVALVGLSAALVARLRRGVWILLPLAALYLVVPGWHGLQRFRDKYEGMRQEGVLFASRAWHNSDSVDWVTSLPEAARLYSNQALILQFLTGRPVYAIPERTDTVKAEARPEFDQQLALMRSDLQTPGSFLVVFDPVRPMTPDEFPDVFEQGLQVVRLLPDGFVMASQPLESVP
jgi:4-amino-4-deoxy-L-arabinose transferase-like glycosyltransferase